MGNLQIVLFVLQVLVALGLISIILIQHGKGADAGAAFGSGASGTVFGSQGSVGFLTKATATLAFIFLANSLALGYLASQSVQKRPGSLLDMDAPVVQEQKVEMDMPAMETEAVDTNDSDIPAIPAE